MTLNTTQLKLRKVQHKKALWFASDSLDIVHEIMSSVSTKMIIIDVQPEITGHTISRKGCFFSFVIYQSLFSMEN